MKNVNSPIVQQADFGLGSIIMPAYKVGKIIEESIHSVISQTYQNWELLIADDCSPDDTAAIVEAVSSSEPRVKLTRCIVNGGPAAARNHALTLAKGNWIAFLDSDDLWLPEKLFESLMFSRSAN